MNNNLNFVFLQFQEDETKEKHLFEAPISVYLKKGQEVYSDAENGRIYGICATDSFLVPLESSRQIIDGVGATYPLRSVTGQANAVIKKIYEPFE